MCGIVAVLNGSTYAHKTDDFFKNAMLASQVRGTDSAGIFQVDRKDALFMYKVPTNASAFLALRTAESLVFDVPNCPLTVGHVRAATMGGIATNNSHPFKAFRDDGSYIIGVHNGTLQQWKTRIDGGLYQVDSEWAFNMIATEGADAFEMFTGAYAFVWWDSRTPDKVCIARNKERSLYYGVTDKKGSLLLASELGMLGWLADRHDQKLQEGTGFFYPEEDYIYSFDLNDIGAWTRVKTPAYDASVGWPTYNPASSVAPSSAMVPMYAHRNDWGFPSLLDDYEDFYNTGYGDEQESLISIIKTELAKARAKKVVRVVGTIVDEHEESPFDPAVLERAISESLATNSDLDQPPFAVPTAVTPVDTGDVVLTNCADGTCTREEVAHAKELNVYGMVVNFYGVWYDSEGSVLYGQYPQWEGGQRTDYDSAVRFVTSKAAHDLYINKNKPTPMVVIGTDKDVNTIFLAPLTTDQRKFLEMSRANEAVH